MAENMKCGNPFDKGKPVYVSTPDELADWLNMLAHAVGIEKNKLDGSVYPLGYEAREQDWYLLAKMDAKPNAVCGVTVRL